MCPFFAVHSFQYECLKVGFFHVQDGIVCKVYQLYRVRPPPMCARSLCVHTLHKMCAMCAQESQNSTCPLTPKFGGGGGAPLFSFSFSFLFNIKDKRQRDEMHAPGWAPPPPRPPLPQLPAHGDLGRKERVAPDWAVECSLTAGAEADLQTEQRLLDFAQPLQPCVTPPPPPAPALLCPPSRCAGPVLDCTPFPGPMGTGADPVGGRRTRPIAAGPGARGGRNPLGVCPAGCLVRWVSSQGPLLGKRGFLSPPTHQSEGSPGRGAQAVPQIVWIRVAGTATL